MRKFIAIAAIFAGAVQTASAEQLWLTMDQVRPYQLENAAHSIVVGNPSIADVTVRDNTNVLLFGKAPGLTNIYVFDENGEAVKNLIIRVRTPSTDMLTVHRGALRTTYNCTTNCEATVTVGDADASFSSIAAQVQNKFSQAASHAQGGEEN